MGINVNLPVDLSTDNEIEKEEDLYRFVRDIVRELNEDIRTMSDLTNEEIYRLVRLEMYLDLVEDLNNYKDLKKSLIRNLLLYKVSKERLGRKEVVDLVKSIVYSNMNPIETGADISVGEETVLDKLMNVLRKWYLYKGWYKWTLWVLTQKTTTLQKCRDYYY